VARYGPGELARDGGAARGDPVRQLRQRDPSRPERRAAERLGIPTLEAWIVAAVAYVGLAAPAIRASTPERALGFPRFGARPAPAIAEEPIAEPAAVG
jgi:hypothetical protein